MKRLLLTLFFLFYTAIGCAQTAVIFVEEVNIREEASVKSKLVYKTTESFILAEKLEQNYKKDIIEIWHKEFNERWTKIRFREGDKVIEGYIYGAFLKIFDNNVDAQLFAQKNKEFINKYSGKYLIDMEKIENSVFYYFEIEFLGKGKINVALEGVEGDHSLFEEGQGRIYYDIQSDKIVIIAGVKGEFAPDGYTWEEYYSMDKGGNPTKKELEAYIKEKGQYKNCFELEIDKNRFEQALRIRD